MNEYLKCYKVKLHVLSPVHIGSGTKIGKKEYIYMPWNHQVIIPDIQKMYAELQKKHLEKDFETYMLDTRTKGLALGKWLSTRCMKWMQVKLLQIENLHRLRKLIPL